MKLQINTTAQWIIIEVAKSANAIKEDASISLMCEHNKAKLCLQKTSARCLIMKRNTTVGHLVYTLR